MAQRVRARRAVAATGHAPSRAGATSFSTMRHEPADPRTQRRSGGNSAAVQPTWPRARSGSTGTGSSAAVLRPARRRHPGDQPRRGPACWCTTGSPTASRWPRSARAIAERLAADDRLRATCWTSSAAATRTWSRPPRSPTTSATRRSGTSASGCSTGWPGSGSGCPTASRATPSRTGSSPAPRSAGRRRIGLDLTAAVRAAMLKYPWTRRDLPGAAPARRWTRRRAARPRRRTTRTAGRPSSAPTPPSSTTCAQARAPFAGRVARLAADRRGVGHGHRRRHRLRHPRPRGLPPGRGAAAGRGRGRADRLAARRGRARRPDRRRAGRSAAPAGPLDRALRRQLHRKDGWISDDDAFAAAVEQVRARAGGRAAGGRRSTARSRRSRRSPGSRRAGPGAWSTRSSVVGRARRPLRARACWPPPQWHEVQVLKFVHHRFVLARPDLALHQRGQARLLAALVEALLSVADRPGRGGPAAAPAARPGRAGGRRVRGAGPHGPVRAGRRRPGRRRPVRTPSGRWPVAARWSTSSPRSPTTRPRRCSTHCPGEPVSCGQMLLYCEM